MSALRAAAAAARAGRLGRGSMPRARACAAALLALATIAPRAPAARAQALPEYEVKAAFLYNFAKFIEWPETALAGPSERLAFCVAGEDPDGRFRAALASAINGKKAGGHATAVRRFGVDTCHIVFIPASERRNVAAIQRAVQGGPVLLVGEWPGFITSGGHVNFVIENDRVRFDVNASGASNVGLKISSKLLALARSVHYDQAGKHP